MWTMPETTAANSYLGGFAGGAPLAGWITWEVLGVLLGGLIGSLSSGRFRAGIEKGRDITPAKRQAYAFAGGLLVGVADLPFTKEDHFVAIERVGDLGELCVVER